MPWDFSANQSVDTIDIVPDEFKGVYVEDKENSKFVIGEPFKGFVAAYTGQAKRISELSNRNKNENNKEAARRVALKSITDTMAEIGWEVGEDEAKVPEILKTNLTELLSQVKGGKEAKLNVDKIRGEFEKRIAEVTAAKDGEVQAMRTSLENYMIERDAATALGEAGTVEKGTDLLMPFIRKSAKVVKDENGQYSVSVVDGENNIRYDKSGNPMTVKTLVEELKHTYPTAFKSEAKGGGGQQPGAGKGGKPPVPGNDSRSSVSKIAAGLGALQKGK